jgi:two-component sensor histidine kinase
MAMHDDSQVLSYPALSLRLRQQELVAAFGRFALRTDSLEEILQEASAIAARGLEAEFAKVLAYEPGDMSFVVRSGVGWRDGVVGKARLQGDLLSPAGYAFRTGKPVISNHLANEQRFRTPALLAEHGVKSAINVLICARDAEPYGVLEGDSTRRGEFNDHDVAAREALANTLAEAVENQQRQDARQALLQENEALVREKELLMKEVHHRVTNSLQLVQSILIMQARKLGSAEAKERVEEAAVRIRAIGAVHRRLYEGGSVVATDAARYLHSLVADLREIAPGADAGRTLTFKSAAFSLPADDITPLGLITSELVTNALKYGRGAIEVEVRRQANSLEIIVSDEGAGFPDGLDPVASGGLGMRLIAALAKHPSGQAVKVDRSVPFGRIVVTTGFGGHGGS